MPSITAAGMFLIPGSSAYGGTKMRAGKLRRLVLVVENLWKPVVEEQLGDGACLGQVQHEPVAIVIVSGVLLIEDRQRRGLRRRCPRSRRYQCEIISRPSGLITGTCSRITSRRIAWVSASSPVTMR